MHTKNPGYKSGDHWVECPVCGFDYLASEMRKRWDGLYVCKKDWEPRHELDFIRARPDKEQADQPVYPSNTSSTVLYCTVEGRSAIPGYATPGCMIPGRTIT